MGHIGGTELKPDISEFSYGFALTSELIHYYQFPLISAPIFLTQHQESKSGGYDVALPRQGRPLFVQFKRCDILTTTGAKHAVEMGLPYYRMYLRATRYSQQHPLLLKLENEGEVFYVAPRFHTSVELNKYYFANSIADRSSFIEPSTIGSIDDSNHHVEISSDGSHHKVCSDTREIEVLGWSDKLVEKLRLKARQSPLDFTDEFLDGIRARLVAVAEECDPKLPHKEVEGRFSMVKDDYGSANALRETVQTLFGCEMLVVPAS